MSGVDPLEALGAVIPMHCQCGHPRCGINYYRAAAQKALARQLAEARERRDRMLYALNAVLDVGGGFPLRGDGDPPHWWRTWLQPFDGLEYVGRRYRLRGKTIDAAIAAGEKEGG